jgi:hypothetical protein
VFTLPTFNLAVNIWRHGNPTSNPPDVITPGNLAYGERSSVPYAVTTTQQTVYGGMWLLTPKGTDIRDDKAVAGQDTCEVPAGSGRFYAVVWVDDAGSGFPNEHRFALIISTSPWPTPFPSPTPSGPTPFPPVSVGVLGPGDPLTLTLPLNPGGVTMIVAMACVTGPGGGTPTVTSAAVGLLTPTMTTGGPSVGSDTTNTLLFVLPVWPGGDVLTITEGQSQWIMYNVYLQGTVANTIDQSGFHAAGVPVNPVSAGGNTTSPDDFTICWAIASNSTSPAAFTAGWLHSGVNDQFLVGVSANWLFATAVQFCIGGTTPSTIVTIVTPGFTSQEAGIAAML